MEVSGSFDFTWSGPIAMHALLGTDGQPQRRISLNDKDFRVRDFTENPDGTFTLDLEEIRDDA